MTETEGLVPRPADILDRLELEQTRSAKVTQEHSDGH